MRILSSLLLFAIPSAVALACSSDPAEPNVESPAPTLRSAVTPVRDPKQAKPNTVIPPFVDCRAPQAGQTGASADGKVCTPVAVAGCTETGKYYPDYASCEVVRTQRPYWPKPAAATPKSDDPRLQDAAFMRELSWVTEQARATACTCCHDSKQAPAGPSQWYIDAAPIWTDTVSDSGIVLFAGLADSSVLGAYPAEENNGFQRTETGFPSTDAARMRAFFVNELARRNISEEKARATPPFGGPLYAISQAPPKPCGDGVGIMSDGSIRWSGDAKARYVYVLESGSKNPGVPPNLDLPKGTLWRLDVLASADALAAGFRYGTTPAGSFQAFPETGRAPALVSGKTYHLAVMRDLAFPAENCLFTYR